MESSPPLDILKLLVTDVGDVLIGMCSKGLWFHYKILRRQTKRVVWDLYSEWKRKTTLTVNVSNIINKLNFYPDPHTLAVFDLLNNPEKIESLMTSHPATIKHNEDKYIVVSKCLDLVYFVMVDIPQEYHDQTFLIKIKGYNGDFPHPEGWGCFEVLCTSVRGTLKIKMPYGPIPMYLLCGHILCISILRSDGGGVVDPMKATIIGTLLNNKPRDVMPYGVTSLISSELHWKVKTSISA